MNHTVKLHAQTTQREGGQNKLDVTLDNDDLLTLQLLNGLLATLNGFKGFLDSYLKTYFVID